MLRRRFTPKLSPNDEICNPMGNTMTVIRLDSIDRYLQEYKKQVELVVPDENTLVKLIVEALVLYYKWNRDFIEHGLDGLPNESDLDTVEEINAREILLECMIAAMHDVDQYHPELRMICKNAQSVSVINARKYVVLLSLNIYNGTLH